MDDVLAGVGGRRVPWVDVPSGVRASIEAHAGARAAEIAGQAGGFSPGLAARLLLDDGSRVVVKAIGPESGAPGSADMYRREAAIAGALPPAAGAPRMLASWEVAGWVAILFEDVADARPPALPW